MTFTATDKSSEIGKSHVWLTPKNLVEALGTFDLDPCAHMGWNLAATHFYEHDDGLKRPWDGFVWMNPPYGIHTKHWLNKLSKHPGGGIALVFARTDTQWFHDIADKASGVFFIKGRITFLRPDFSKSHNAGAPSCLIAFGRKALARIKDSKIKGCLFAI